MQVDLSSYWIYFQPLIKKKRLRHPAETSGGRSRYQAVPKVGVNISSQIRSKGLPLETSYLERGSCLVGFHRVQCYPSVIQA